MNIEFKLPIECQHCRFHNFKITGVIYNNQDNYYNLKIKCMRCGKIDTQLKTQTEFKD